MPLPRIPELLAATARTEQRHGLPVATFGHAGDGNMHPTVVFDPEHPASVAAAREAFSDIVVEALALGGTMTGEHGVGLLKAPFLERELSSRSVALQQRLKAALDPRGLLNPGKALPPPAL